MRSTQMGDASAYSCLLEQLAQATRAIVIHRWRRPDGVEDIVQDVLLSIHSVRHTYNPARPFTPWLLAIIRNRMVDMGRRQSRKMANEVAVDELPETFVEAEPNYLDVGPGDVEKLYAAIASLPEGQRQAVEMLKLKEMSVKEASTASGQSASALKVAMHRALKKLRSTLGKERA